MTHLLTISIEGAPDVDPMATNEARSRPRVAPSLASPNHFIGFIKSSARHFYLRISPVALQARPMTNDPLYALRQSDSTFFFFKRLRR